MENFERKVVLVSLLLSLICSIQVASLPLPEDWDGLLQRTKRSLLWRWNSMKPVGGSCRDHSECGTNYCRKYICSILKRT
ncbi:liver-expressed antimicrobial peptide 2 [Nelusetta ayraudi]|uniref:liver-expressed antimicrobial peptide 2 n=1 Tax=Nelusetta ayraudi TaxID=303726 RepID=UPI00308E8792|nr:liver-expressed antimicrobial peptide 2 isoform C [Thamnaconus modestus]